MAPEPINPSMSSPPKIGAPAVAVVSGSVLAGAMASLSAFVIPVLLDTNVAADHMLRQWARLYHYGHIYMPALCVATCGVYAYAAIDQKGRAGSRYILAALSTIAMVPFTWLIMAPTNNTLFRLESLGSTVTDLTVARGLLVKWAWLHAVRSLSPLLGVYLGFTGVVQELGLRV